MSNPRLLYLLAIGMGISFAGGYTKGATPTDGVYPMGEVDCNVTVTMESIRGGGIDIHIYHSPKCRIGAENGASLLHIVPNVAGVGDSPSIGSDSVESIVSTAMSLLGKRYGPAMAGPDTFDCSGFVYYIFRIHGIDIPRSSAEQAEIGHHLSRKDLKRGDLLFFDTSGRGHINHSAIYLGDGRFIHSSSGKAYGVTISDLDHGFYRDRFRWGVGIESLYKRR